MSKHADNMRYLQSLVDQIKPIPRAAAVEVATRIFLRAVEATPIDSGNAAANWQILPYVGAPQYSQMQLMWGYGDVAPTIPVGYKFSKGAESEYVFRYQFEIATQAAVLYPTVQFDGITVFNPIEEGSSAFAPGIDTWYEENSVDKVPFETVITDSVSAGYAATVSRFAALRKG